MSASPPITDPRSRHNIHVTDRSDLRDIGEWSVDRLFEALTAAEAVEGDHAAVLDYARTNIYIVGFEDMTYHPPEALGFESPPALAVTTPRLFDPAEPQLVPHESVHVKDEFDILIPAFDWETLSEDDLLPPVERRPSESPTDAGTPG